MIANITPVCYSNFMKQLMRIGIVVSAVLVVCLCFDELTMFIAAGKIPFTKLALSPVGVIIFWVLTAAFFFMRESIIDGFWLLVEAAAIRRQRRLNRQNRLATSKKEVVSTHHTSSAHSKTDNEPQSLENDLSQQHSELAAA